MKGHMSEFERGRRIVLVLLVLAISFGAAALLFAEEDSNQQVCLILAAFGCVAGVVISSLLFCRCPYCGKRIVSGVLVVKVCPKCKRSLATGKKVKKS